MYKIALSALCFFSHQASFAQTALNPGEVLNFQIARDGITRISLQNDSIEDIYVYPSDYQDNIEHHKSGHVFVVAEGMDSPLYVTLITKKGIAQDLKVTATKKKAEPIVIRCDDEAAQAQTDVEQTTTLIEKFIQGIVPTGYYLIEAPEASRSRGALSCVVDKAYQKAPYRVMIYTVKNETDEPITLDNRLLWEEGDLAIAFDQPELRPHHTAKMYVIQKI
ncbi:TraK domain-containing protein [Candidatus Odyssella thessalonicensis]|uniref:TraK domain-containing protein n=1 Tax=Candidatus Odyssella thessalonicensis TaxID=84647 RepID=UPI000225B982|nr:type-F conjugative transfer system secretin TraK [Candidatus Odyssella thessalonicensis]